ncbi:MAG: hypothetical protein A3A81_03165 [Omnitrophica bacterium RIFCSPLOWO2_01_FULL_45_10b]|nr:MAG: hypothetical protein A3A81_03165 [Omnitrophica bacterium RIFCSPLOWO2_01_FULL_45_10b]
MPRKILLVDDDPDIINMLAMRLGKLDFQVIKAHSGEEALELMERELPDVVISDVHMGGMSGFDLCAQAKNNEKIKSIPVILLCGDDQSHAQVLSGSAATSFFVEKPFKADKLLETIESAFTSSRSNSSREKHILLVDDEPEILEMLGSFFLESGFKVTTGRNGFEALEQMYRSKPDIILLDLFMPQMDGFGFLNAMKVKPQFSGIPVLAMSGHYAEGEIGLARKKVEGFVAKPFTPDAIFEQIKQIKGF